MESSLANHTPCLWTYRLLWKTIVGFEVVCRLFFFDTRNNAITGRSEMEWFFASQCLWLVTVFPVRTVNFKDVEVYFSFVFADHAKPGEIKNVKIRKKYARTLSLLLPPPLSPLQRFEWQVAWYVVTICWSCSGDGFNVWAISHRISYCTDSGKSARFCNDVVACICQKYFVNSGKRRINGQTGREPPHNEGDLSNHPCHKAQS